MHPKARTARWITTGHYHRPLLGKGSLASSSVSEVSTHNTQGVAVCPVCRMFLHKFAVRLDAVFATGRVSSSTSYLCSSNCKVQPQVRTMGDDYHMMNGGGSFSSRLRIHVIECEQRFDYTFHVQRPVSAYIRRGTWSL